MREEAKAKKAHRAKIDGQIIPLEVEKLRDVIRLVWSQNSVARKNCIKRALITEGEFAGFSRCENTACKKRVVPKVYADHIEVMGSIFSPTYFVRMWCSSKHLQALCKKCHDKKTKEEREAASKDLVKTEDADDADFY